MKSRLLKMALSMSLLFTASSTVNAFASDISGHWAEGVMTSWVEKGFFSADSEGKLSPDAYIMRAEFVDMINLVLGLTQTSGVAFDDVPEGAWFYEAIDIAVTAGYASGVSETTFSPSGQLTREQAASMVYRAIGLAPASETHFVDHDDISPWAVSAVGAMSDIGYLSGKANGEFAPQSPLTRAEAISCLERVRIGIESSIVQPRETITLMESGTVLENATVAGDLHITMPDDKDEIFIDSVIVIGDIYINGTGNGTVFINDAIIYGDIIMEQTGVNLEVSGNTNVSKIEIVNSCHIEAKELTGTIDQVVFDTEISKSYRTTLAMNLASITINAPVSVVLERMIDRIDLSETATGTIVNFSNLADVLHLDIHAMTTLSGAGTVGTLQANCIGITVGTDILVHTVSTANGVGAPVVSIIDTILQRN